MRIGIDYRPALVNREGIGRYTRELVRGLLVADPALSLGLFGYTLRSPRVPRSELGLEAGPAELARLRIPSRWMPFLLRRTGRGVDDLVGGPAIFHHTQYNTLAVREASEVITIHDCIYLHDADYLDREAAGRMTHAVRGVAARARRILVPSEFVGAEVVMHFGVMPHRITVTPLGCDHVARALGDYVPPVASPPFLLTVSRVDNRKNHVRMLRAFERLAREGFPHRWVIAGPAGYGSEHFARALAASPVRDRVEWRQFVEESELYRLYAAADLFLFLSLSEGFGLPIIEAMAAGTAVLPRCVTSMPEVGGDAALYAEPTDEDAIFEELRRVLGDRELRDDMVRQGRVRAAEFPWRETARKTAAAYRGAARPPAADGPAMRHSI